MFISIEDPHWSNLILQQQISGENEKQENSLADILISVYYHNTNFFFISNHFNHFSYYQDIANLQTSFIIILMKSCSTQALIIPLQIIS